MIPVSSQQFVDPYNNFNNQLSPTNAQFVNNEQGSEQGPEGVCFGTLVSENGWTYTGQLVNGKKEGKGSEQGPDGSTFEGMFKNGERHGQGTYTKHIQNDIFTYSGLWQDGKLWEGEQYRTLYASLHGKHGTGGKRLIATYRNGQRQTCDCCTIF